MYVCMEQQENSTTVDISKESGRRPIRNKRYSRRNLGEEKRLPKKLFTPEIKRFLKDWLIRKRDNPYPNREEKKKLAVQTGLTYIQVCNWFANWRRKLKNAGQKASQRRTWGHLIKSYNSQVHGNVEHFSICSDDSIWHELEATDAYVTDGASSQYSKQLHAQQLRHCITPTRNDDINHNACGAECCNLQEYQEIDNPFSHKYKNLIMEKYLRDCQQSENCYASFQDLQKFEQGELSKPSMISKWLESAANFRPCENNYLNWNCNNSFDKSTNLITNTTQDRIQRNKAMKKSIMENGVVQVPHSYHENISIGRLQKHDREELDAAEALTTLANAHVNKTF